MSFFFDPEVTMSNKLMEVIYIFIGFMVIYTAVKNLRDKENPNRYGTFTFWFVLGILIGLGKWLPSVISGILVLVMCVSAIFHKVKKGRTNAPLKSETEAAFAAIGMKIFVPAFVPAEYPWPSPVLPVLSARFHHTSSPCQSI